LFEKETEQELLDYLSSYLTKGKDNEMVDCERRDGKKRRCLLALPMEDNLLGEMMVDEMKLIRLSHFLSHSKVSLKRK